MSGELALGLASGFRKRRDQQKVEAEVTAERTRQNARQDASDARVAEASDYAKTQRPMQERATAATVANAEQSTAFNKQKFDEAARAAHDEGFYDLMDQLDRGVSPQAALSVYNSRGAHKIDPASFHFDPRTKNAQFTDEDGPQTVNATQMKGILADSLSNSATVPKTSTLKSDEAIIENRTGKVIAEGPTYRGGKEKPLIKGKPGEVIYDPTTKRFKVIPGVSTGGKAAKTVSVDGSALAPWNLQTAQKHNRDILAATAGLKYDPETEQVTGGKPGATRRWMDMSAMADQVTQRMQDTMGPAQVAHLVTDAYDGVKTDEEYRAEAEKNTTRQRLGGGGPDTMLTREEPVDLWQARIKTTADAMKAAAVKEADDKLFSNLPAVGENPPDAGTTQPLDENDVNSDGVDDETGDEIPTADDLAPAGGAPAPAATSAAPSPRAHYPVTIDRVTSPDAKAMQILKASPQVMQLLQAPVDPGKTAIVKFPNGKAYFLAGTELREFKNFKPPSK